MNPLEVLDLARVGLTLERINFYAKEFQLQRVDLYPRCLAKASLDNIYVYYIRFESKRLMEFRKKLFEIARHQSPSFAAQFDQNPYLHATVGFIENDLFTNPHHVFKHDGTCVMGLDIQ